MRYNVYILNNSNHQALNYLFDAKITQNFTFKKRSSKASKPWNIDYGVLM